MDENKAIFNGFRYGPSFGDGDLEIWRSFSGSYCRKVYYEIPIRKTENQFIVEELEVFQII